jgi:NAD(P)-dependent dehydrogenase (short-subunit alcohol dehydrogenase family)
MFSLESKIAIVTGGASGIGLATARRFAAAGAKVVIANRSDSSALAESFGAAYLPVDVAEESQVKALVAEVVRRHGRIDILVNSAGLIDDMLPIAEVSAEAMRRHFEVNSMGVWATMRHAAPHTAGGSIINVSSVAALLGVATYAAYSASKAAVVSLTQTAAVELADKGIRVNCVCPGSIDTPMLRQQANADIEIGFIEKAAAAGRIGQPEEVAALIHFLAADDCRYITGQAIMVDGGLLNIHAHALIETVIAARK